MLLHSNIIGSGNPLIILHGFLGMSDNWKSLAIQYAEAGFEVHMVDQRNHGRSFHSEDFNYDFLSDDLNQYLTHKNIERAYIIGHSMGGKTAMQFACDHPNKVEKLLIADIAPKFYPAHHQEIINALSSLDLPSISSRKEADEALGQYLSEPGIRMFLLKNLYRLPKSQNPTLDKPIAQFGFRCNLAVLATKMNEIGENISSTDLFQGKTLFLRGDRSEYIMPLDETVINRHFPDAKI